MRNNYIMLPTEYIQELYVRGKKEKAQAFIEYYLDFKHENINSVRFYQSSWQLKSTSTTAEWIKEFKNEIDRFFAVWQLKNSSHYSSVRNSAEQKPNTKRTDNIVQSPILSELEKNDRTQTEQKKNEIYNINNNNINADFDKSTKKSSKKKISYPEEFEIAWHRYDKKSSNKKRSLSIWLRSWKNTDINTILQAIDNYKSSIDLKYQKDFDGFLNGLIDNFVPQRVWIVDKHQNKHIGWFKEVDSMFVSDKGQEIKLESANIAEYIKHKRFGYLEK